jgi:tripartite-type tricarboxylate transporter receptor subunit TctC
MATNLRLLLGAVAFVGSISGSMTAQAADFFAGKTIKVLVGFGPASAYAIYGQLAAHHLGRFIPGKPNVVISFMPGASGLTSMNYLHQVAPRDGTVIAVPMQDLASQQALGMKGARYDATELSYLGRATTNVPVHMVWHTAPATTIDEIKKREIATAASSSTGTHADLPRAQNALIKTKWKVVGGYQDGARLLAMERGEVHAAVAAATLFNGEFKPSLDNGLVKVIVQYADFRHPLFPDVPTVMEFADSAETKGVFKLLTSLSTVGRAYVAPPGVPPQTVAILRKALTDMFNDPAFRADAEKRGADLMPMSGEELAAYVKAIVATPSAIVSKTNEVIAMQ